MGSHSVSCHQTQVKAPRLNPAQLDRPVLELPTPEGWKAELTLALVIYQNSLPICRQSPIQVPDSVSTGSRTRDLSIVSPTLYLYTTTLQPLRRIIPRLHNRANIKLARSANI